MSRRKEAGKKQIDLLADYITGEIPGEPSQDEGAGETAVRLLREYRSKLNRVVKELEGYE